MVLRGRIAFRERRLQALSDRRRRGGFVSVRGPRYIHEHMFDRDRPQGTQQGAE
jgi:hypothetical protein